MDRLEQTELFQAASCIALYHAIPGEVQTAGFIEKWYQKKKLLLPLIVGDDLRVLLYEVPESLKPGPFGILGPTIMQYTRNIYVRDKVLHVSLTSSVLRSELTLCRERLVKSLNDYSGASVITNIVFH